MITRVFSDALRATLSALLLMYSGFAAAETPKPRFTTLHEFAWGVVGFTDGFSPTGVVIGPGGVLYGTTNYGGSANAGTVFSLPPRTFPGGPWTGTVLYSFSGGADGAFPTSTLVPQACDLDEVPNKDVGFSKTFTSCPHFDCRSAII